jgi:hypothetical protein
MTIELELSPEREARLLTKAQKHGQTIQEWLQSFVNGMTEFHIRTEAEETDTWDGTFETLADDAPQPPKGTIVDVSRESLYPDRW